METKTISIGRLVRVKHGKHKKDIGRIVSINTLKNKVTIEDPISKKLFTVSSTNVKVA